MAVVLVCVVVLWLVGAPAWAVVAVLGSAAPAIVHWWFRRDGSPIPSHWLRDAFVVTGLQQLLGVIPTVGVALAVGTTASAAR